MKTSKIARFTNLILMIVLLTAMCVFPAGAEENGGILDGIEWHFADGVMTLKGDGILTGPNRPWDAYKPDTQELIIGSAFPDHRDWTGYAGLKALKKVTFETDYCRTFLQGLIALCYLMAAQAGTAARAVGNDLVTKVQ